MATVSDIVSLRIDTKCRICMFPKPNLSSLFRRGLSMKVMKLADIKMYEGDGLPSTICLDCELEVNRCVNFIGQIQRADMKLREMIDRESEFIEAYERDKELAERSKEMELGIQKVEDGDQEACTSQIDIEEFNVKQEITTLDNFLDEEADPKSESDHDHFEVALARNDEPEDEHELNPLNHVDVMEDENRSDAMDVPLDPLGQEEPLIESEKCDSNPSTDPLTFMKQEAVSMDIDKNSPEPSGSSSTVRRSVASMSFTIWPQIVNSNVTSYGLTNSVYPQQYNVLLMKQNAISNTMTQGNAPATVISTDVSNNSTSLLSSSTDSSKMRNLLPKSTEPEEVHNSSISKTVKKIKGKCTQQQLHCSIEEYKKKWRENVSFCLICDLECGSKELLEEHKEKPGFFCRICTLEFKKHSDLETHFFSHKPVKCNFCQEICFTRKDLHLHKKKMHESLRFQCDVCNQTFAKNRTLKAHKIIKHSGSGIKYKCVVCEKTFMVRHQLYGHLIKVHNAFEFQECKFCDKLFPRPDNLKQHIKSTHLDCDLNSLLACKTCGKVFKGVHSLSQHEKKHDDTECLCEQCGQSIKGKIAMRIHMNLKHSKKALFPCRYCPEQFKIRIELQRHYSKCKEKKQTIPDPVFCEICGKQFKNLTILNMHKKIHSIERPYKCEECSATFRQAVALRTHGRVHSSVGKYCCDNCGMTFRWKQTYDKHLNKCSASSVKMTSTNK